MPLTSEYLKYFKQILTGLKGEADNNILRVGDFNTPFSTMEKLSKQEKQGNVRLESNFRPNKLNRHIQNINLTAAEYSFFSSSNITFFRIDHITK